MCGIIGFTGPKNFKQLDNLQQLIYHRGNDELSQYYQNGVNLGMNRLAINDLSKGIYPLKYKHYSLIYNGEIYNQDHLKQKLKEKNIKFHTQCDGEVILPLFDQLGTQAFSKLEGMFAIALIDHQNKKLILARDKSGQKPLYYFVNQRQFAFSSEIKALIPLIKEVGQLNLKKLATYLREGSLLGQETLLKKIKKVEAASYLEIDLENISHKTKKYWHPKITNTVKSEVQLIKQLDQLLVESVSKRLLADVGVGSFLSGGVDSSLISYYAANLQEKFHTYSVVFPGYENDDEARFSDWVAKSISTEHTRVVCDAEKAKEVIDQIGKFIDEPIIDPAVIPTYLIAKEARKKVKVVLSGEGADELFGGYPRYTKHLNRIRLQKYFPQPFWQIIKTIIPKRISAKLDYALTPLGEYYSSQNVWTTQELKQLLPNSEYEFQHSTPPKKSFDKNPLLAMQLRDYHHYLAEQLLMKVDKFTMINNLEARSPFLDTKIINFAFSLKNKHRTDKYLLRKVAQKHLPKKIAWRQKKGFTVPLGDWYRHQLRSTVLETTNNLSDLEIFNGNYLKQIIEEHLTYKKNHRDKIWSLIVLDKWLLSNKININAKK